MPRLATWAPRQAGPDTHDPFAWMTRARCATEDTEIFFPDTGGNPSRPKRLCKACPVRDTCLQYALTNREVWGCWGGLSTPERIAALHLATPTDGTPDISLAAAFGYLAVHGLIDLAAQSQRLHLANELPVDPDETTRMCVRCDQWKPLTDYPVRAQTRSNHGRDRTCTTCTSARTLEAKARRVAARQQAVAA
jgi:WhiB family transcriptional regulator, redox-sensing transcriptional regulator